MLSRSFFPNFGQGPFPKIAGKSPVILEKESPVILLDNYGRFITMVTVVNSINEFIP